MSSAQKAILLVLALVVGGVIVYALLAKPAAPASPQPEQPSATSEAPSGTTIEQPAPTIGGATSGEAPAPATEGVSATATGGRYILKKLSDVPVVAYWASKTSDEVFYLTADGYVMSAKEGPDTDVSKQAVGGVYHLENSPSGNKALVSFSAPTAPKWAIFDGADKVWRPLPSNILTAAWGATDNGIVATVRAAGGAVTLSYIDLTKTPFDSKTLVKDFRFNGVTLSTKSPEEILIMERPTALAQSRVWQLNTKTGALTLLLSPENGLTLAWGSNKDVLFRFAAPNRFSILNRALSIIQPFTYVTFPQKCDGAATEAFCFVPKDQSMFNSGNTQPDDYFMKKVFTNDDLYRFDLVTGGDAPILNGNSADAPALDATDVQNRGSSVYFVNRYDNFLYAVQKAQ